MKRLFTDGTIYTMSALEQTVEAVLVEHGQVVATGTRESLTPQADEIVLLRGAVMYPGFVDSHSHLTRYARQLQAHHIEHCTTIAEVMTSIEQYISQQTQPIYYVTGYTLTEPLHKQLLDTLTTKPLLIYTTHQQIAFVNSAAFEIANIDAHTKGAKKDAQGFTGVLVEEAVTKATKYLFNETLEELTSSLTETLQHMVALGYTSAHTGDLADFHDYHLPIRAFEAVTKNMPFRLHLLRHHRVFEQMIIEDVSFDETWLEMGAMTICLDGPFTTYDAQVTQGYYDKPNMSGHPKYDDKEIERLVFLARSYNEAMAMQVNGDGAAEQACRILQKFPSVPSKRDRFIYNTLLNEVLLKEMKHLYVGFDMQLINAEYIIAERLGHVRDAYVQPIARLISNEYICAGGSNSRAKDMNPFSKIAKAAQQIGRQEAVKLYTTNAAQLIGKEQQRGQIAEGYVADFTVTNIDLLTCDEQQLITAQAMMTIVAGHTVFSR